MMEKETLARAIAEVAKGAGELILNREDIQVSEKGDVANIVTTMDVRSQDYILTRLKQLLPEAKVIAEESNHNEFDDGYVWVVDPIDGTSNYAYDLKHSCISIALLYQKKGDIGVVYDPYLKEMFVGIKGFGSYLNGKATHVNQNALPSSLVVVGTSPYAKEKADITFHNMKKIFVNSRDIRRSGSATLDLCYVACGRFDAFYEASLAPWDYSAAATIIKESGGIIEAIEPDVWGYEKSIGIIAGNQHNYLSLLNLLKE